MGYIIQVTYPLSSAITLSIRLCYLYSYGFQSHGFHCRAGENRLLSPDTPVHKNSSDSKLPPGWNKTNQHGLWLCTCGREGQLPRHDTTRYWNAQPAMQAQPKEQQQLIRTQLLDCFPLAPNCQDQYCVYCILKMLQWQKRSAFLITNSLGKGRGHILT